MPDAPAPALALALPGAGAGKTWDQKVFEILSLILRPGSSRREIAV